MAAAAPPTPAPSPHPQLPALLDNTPPPEGSGSDVMAVDGRAGAAIGAEAGKDVVPLTAARCGRGIGIGIGSWLLLSLSELTERRILSSRSSRSSRATDEARPPATEGCSGGGGGAVNCFPSVRPSLTDLIERETKGWTPDQRLKASSLAWRLLHTVVILLSVRVKWATAI